MGGCASKPKEVDGDAPEIAPAAPDVTPAVAEEVVTEANENKEDSQPAEVISAENKEEVPVALAAEAAPSAEITELVAAEKGEEKAKEDEAPKTE